MPITTPVYCTREDITRALDSPEAARNFAQIDGAVEAAAEAVYGLTRRRFYPFTGTRYMDWPNHQYARSYRLWLDSNEVASVISLVSGGTTIPSTDYFLRRSDDLDEPPYTFIEVDLDSSSAFSAGDTHQRSVAITGVFCGCPVNEGPAGTITEALADTTGTTVVISDSSLVGVGTILKVDSERMLVTDRAMADTGVNTANALTAANNNVSITMSTTTGAPTVGDVILIDSERMLVIDRAGSTLTVKRAWDGTVLATHANPSDIYALRTLTVVRGFLGTTAATHLDDATAVKFLPPSLVRRLNIAEACNILLQESSGYGRESGSGEGTREFIGRGLDALREQVRTTYGRKARVAAV
ncbi:MAG TPA: hypothetical protein VFY84_13475 [Jiangellales bacterium]|nr:hypothetical protein [Jiangellales bacterium]